MSNTSPPAEGSHTDIAALAPAVVAVVVALFIAPEEYSALKFFVSFTLIATILGYVWPADRRWLQSLAVASAIGLASIPAIGFFDEAARSRAPIPFLFGDEDWDCKKDPCGESGEPKSRVPNRDLMLAWLALGTLSYAGDRIAQQRRRRRKPSNLADSARTVIRRPSSISWGFFALAIGAGLWLLSYVNWVPEGIASVRLWLFSYVSRVPEGIASLRLWLPSYVDWVPEGIASVARENRGGLLFVAGAGLVFAVMALAVVFTRFSRRVPNPTGPTFVEHAFKLVYIAFSGAVAVTLAFLFYMKVGIIVRSIGDESATVPKMALFVALAAVDACLLVWFVRLAWRYYVELSLPAAAAPVTLEVVDPDGPPPAV